MFTTEPFLGGQSPSLYLESVLVDKKEVGFIAAYLDMGQFQAVRHDGSDILCGDYDQALTFVLEPFAVGVAS